MPVFTQTSVLRKELEQEKNLLCRQGNGKTGQISKKQLERKNNRSLKKINDIFFFHFCQIVHAQKCGSGCNGCPECRELQMVTGAQ